MLEDHKVVATIMRPWLLRMLIRLTNPIILVVRPKWEPPEPPFVLGSRKAAAPIVRLWLLRMLVPLGCHKKFIASVAERFEWFERFEKTENLLTQLLRLKHQIEQEVNDEFDRKSALKKLSKTHREATKICKTVRKNLAEKKNLAENWIIQTLRLEHWIKGVFDKKSALKELTKLHRIAEKELKNAKVPDPLARNIKQFAKLLNLSETDCRIIEFFMLIDNQAIAYMCKNFDPFNDLWKPHLDLDNRDNALILSVFLSVLLALPQDEIRLSLRKNSTMSKLGMVKLNSD